MTIADHLLATAPQPPPPLSVDPFGSDDTLAEADLQKINWDVAASVCWLLFDLKYAFVYPEANTAVLVARGVSAVHWERPGNADDRWQTFMVGSTTTRTRGDALEFSVGAMDGARLTITAGTLEFWAGEAEGADDAPPDYTEDDDATIRSGLTDWNWPFRPVGHSVRTVRTSSGC